MKTTTYICNSCKGEFKVAKAMYERYDTYAPSYYKLIPVCPFCGSDGFEQKVEKIPTKSELKQYIHLKREIEKDKKKLATLKGKEGYTELYELIENNKLRCIALLLKLQDLIYSIDDSLLRQIFELRYVEGKSWTAIEVALGSYTSADCLRMLHDRYLEKRKQEDDDM